MVGLDASGNNSTCSPLGKRYSLMPSTERTFSTPAGRVCANAWDVTSDAANNIAMANKANATAAAGTLLVVFILSPGGCFALRSPDSGGRFERGQAPRARVRVSTPAFA